MGIQFKQKEVKCGVLYRFDVIYIVFSHLSSSFANLHQSLVVPTIYCDFLTSLVFHCSFRKKKIPTF